mgnify:CR=1 FL=1
MKNLLKMSDLSPAELTHILDVPINSRHSRSWAARPRCWQERRLPDVLQGIHPNPHQL